MTFGYDTLLELGAEGEAFTIAQFDEAVRRGLGEPSLLSGWTRAHVISHLEGNALALCNLVTWARTGVETPMYRDHNERAAQIEAGARRPDREIVDGARAASEQLARALRDLPPDVRSFEVRTALGRTVPVTQVPWMRIRETWIHPIDLDTGASIDDVPALVVRAMLDEVVVTLSAKPGCPALVLTASDVGGTWTTTPKAAASPPDAPGAAPVEVPVDVPIEVSAPAARLLGWLIGRPAPGAEQALPDVAIPPWL